jgi:hypothetical protein
LVLYENAFSEKEMTGLAAMQYSGIGKIKSVGRQQSPDGKPKE